MADWARSGVVALTGKANGPPLVPPGRAATVARELGSRFAAMTDGTSSPVLLDGARLLSERAAWTGRTRSGAVSVGGSCRLLPTADGWAAVSCARQDDVALLGALVGQTLTEDLWPRAAGWLLEHSGDELAAGAELLGLAAAPVRPTGAATVPTPAVPRPVGGLLVVDFSALWAGPLCTHLLGAAGARVIKVETPARPDGARLGNPAFYRLLHAGHRSVVLDPTTAGGREAIAALVEAADVVVEASRPRALARFGVDAAAAVAAGKTWVSITAAGRDADRIGFGDDVAASAGLVALAEDGAPLFCGDALADPLTGLTAAVLAMTAPADGTGVLWDVSMSGVVGATLDAVPTRPAQCARSDGSGGWVVDTADGPVAVTLPTRRPATRRPGSSAPAQAPVSGADTEAVLHELGLPSP